MANMTAGPWTSSGDHNPSIEDKDKDRQHANGYKRLYK
jgi:hypothetical protein